MCVCLKRGQRCHCPSQRPLTSLYDTWPRADLLHAMAQLRLSPHHGGDSLAGRLGADGSRSYLQVVDIPAPSAGRWPLYQTPTGRVTGSLRERQSCVPVRRGDRRGAPWRPPYVSPRSPTPESRRERSSRHKRAAGRARCVCGANQAKSAQIRSAVVSSPAKDTERPLVSRTPPSHHGYTSSSQRYHQVSRVQTFRQVHSYTSSSIGYSTCSSPAHSTPPTPTGHTPSHSPGRSLLPSPASKHVPRASTPDSAWSDSCYTGPEPTPRSPWNTGLGLGGGDIRIGLGGGDIGMGLGEGGGDIRRKTKAVIRR